MAQVYERLFDTASLVSVLDADRYVTSGALREWESAMRPFDEWLQKRSYSPRTRRLYIGYVARIERWLRRNSRPALRQVRPDDLKAYAKSLPYTYASRMQARAAIKAYWTYLGRKEAPLYAIPCPKRGRMVCRALEEGDIDKLLVAARSHGDRQYAAACALYYAAFRREEVSKMQWTDVGEGMLRVVGKGAVEAYVPLHEELVRALAPLPRESHWIFPGRTPGTHVSPATINVWIALAGAAAGLKNVSCHILRHTALATINDVTGDLRAAQEVARHSDPKMTAGYTRATKARLRDAMRALNPKAPEGE